MSIEKDLKQRKPFKNEREKALVNILFTHNWLIDRLNGHFKEYGITRQQYNILRILNGAEIPLTTSEIRSRMIDRMSDITRLIDRLIKKKLVKKSIKPSDRRLVDVVITKRGKTLVHKIARNKKPIHTYLDKLNKDEAKTLNRLLHKIRSS